MVVDVGQAEPLHHLALSQVGSPVGEHLLEGHVGRVLAQTSEQLAEQ